MFALLPLLGAACATTSTIEAPSSEAQTASDLERDPRSKASSAGLKTACDYWTNAVNGLSATPDSPALRSWIAAKKEEACTSAATNVPTAQTTPAPRSSPVQTAAAQREKTTAWFPADAPSESSGGSPPAPAGEALSNWSAPRRRNADEVSDAEIRSGRCEPSRLSALQAHLHRNNEIRKFLNETDWLMLVAQKIAVVKVEGVTFGFDSLIGGEIHVFAVGYNDPELLVLNSQGDPSMLASGYEMRWPAREILSDEEIQFKASGRIRSRMIQMNNGESLSVRVKGKGCMLIAIYKEL
jgi:hypothetical protein